MASETPSTQKTPQPQTQSLQHLSESLTRQITKGISQESLIQELVGQGWPEVTAKRFVVNAARAAKQHRRIGSEARETKAKARMIRGLLWLIAGLGILLISLEVRHLTGGIPLLYVGAIVIGFLDFFIGLMNWIDEQH
jgi:hypothetical protein